MLVWRPDKTLGVEPPGNGTSYKTFIDLLTTVHFISVLTAFATYFGVIQTAWHSLPLFFFVCFFLLLICSCGECWQRQQHSVQTKPILLPLFFCFEIQTLTVANMPLADGNSRVLANVSMTRPSAADKHFPGILIRYRLKRKKEGERFQQLSLSLVCSQRK